MRFIPLLFLVLCSFMLPAQSPATQLLGAWESTFIDGEGRRSKLTMTIVDGFMVMTAYNAESGDFIATLGGRWRADWDNFSITYEFDSSDPTQVGGVATMPYSLSGSVLIFNEDKFWTRVDDGSPGALSGAWKIIGRKHDGILQDLTSQRTGPQKTMKILSGKRFQWISFNTETKQFSTTHGGSYTTNEKGLYIEKIEYLSEDPTRAGKQLSFDFKLANGDWVHRGVSTTGDLIYEVWRLRK